MSKEYKVGDLVYDANIYDGLNTSLTDLEFFKGWLPKNKNSKVLELCCGTGRLTIPIAEEGYQVTGIDITKSMLDRAKEKAQKANLDISFIEADITKLELKEQFDAVLIPFNSIHHLYKTEDLIKVFNNVRSLLKKGGVFIFDCYNPNISYIADCERKPQVIANYTTEDGRDIKIEQHMKYESDSQINRIEWHYFINGKFDSIQNLDMRMYFPQELDYYLQNFFTVEKKFGSFDEDDFTANSEKQIFVCH